MAEPSSAITDTETMIAHEGPAFYCNRALINVGALVHIAFVEQVSLETLPKFRTAVALPHQTAIELANLLKVVLGDLEKQLAEAQAKGAAVPPAAKTDG